MEGLKDRIRERIEEKGLFCEVHHYIRKKECGIRNHLDCNGLLTDQAILNGVTNAFINNIYTHSFFEKAKEITTEDYLLVGVANSGVLLASRIAMITGLPMIYYVPPRKDGQFTVHEKEWKSQLIDMGKRTAILILGVNVTGESIDNVQAFLKSNSPDESSIEIQSVLGIVNRDKYCASVAKLKKQGIRVDFLLEEYPIDWCSYTDTTCPYKRQCRESENKDGYQLQVE